MTHLVGLLVGLHVALGEMDTHTQVLVYGLAFGPFLLLVLVTVVHARRLAREEAAPADDPAR